jgi:hypothetical protein
MRTVRQIAATIIALCQGALGDSGQLYCKDVKLPGPCWGSTCTEIPAHNVIFGVQGSGNGTCYGGPFADSCAEMIGARHDGYSNAECDKGSMSYDFWITPDQCMNLEYDGKHVYCCDGFDCMWSD